MAFPFFGKKKKELEQINQNLLEIFERLWSRPPSANTVNKLEAYHTSPLLEDLHRVSDDIAAHAMNFNVYLKADWQKNKRNAKPIEHPIKDFLLNPCKSDINIDSFSFYKFYPIYYELCGEWPRIVMNDSRGFPYEMFVIPPNWILSFPSSSMPFYRVSSTTGTGKMRYVSVNPADMDVMRNCQTWNPYDRGRGAVEILGDEIDLEDFMVKYAKSFFFNNATPEIIVSSMFRSQADMDAAKQSWLERLSNKAKAPAFIKGDQTQVIPLGFTQRESDFVKSRVQLFDQARQHFAIPPELKGQLQNSNRATIEAAEHIYCAYTKKPKLDRLQKHNNDTIVPRYPDGDKIVVIYDEIVPDDKTFNRDTGLQGWDRGILTLNESRVLIGLEMDQTDNGNKRKFDLQPKPEIPVIDQEEEIDEAVKSFVTAKKEYSETVRKAFWQEMNTKAEKEEKSFQKASKGFGSDQQARFEALLTKHLKGKSAKDKQTEVLIITLADFFGKDENLFVRDSLKAPWKKAIYNGVKTASTLMQIKPEFLLFDESITRFLKKQGLNKAKQINETTKLALRDTIDQVIQANGSMKEIEDSIRSTYSALTGEIENMPAYRAERIARTETIGSANYGAFERYKKSDVEQKEWLHEYDDKVRSYEEGDKFDHTDAGIAEKIVDIDDPFEVSGELLMFPGDGSMGASAGNTIECRCTLLPVIR